MNAMDRPGRLNRLANITLKVNEEADKDTFYDTSKALGSLAAKSFRDQTSGMKKSQHRAQMTGLENIAETTMKVSDVLDYIKKQMARQPGWTTAYEGERFGERLKNYIENDLKETRKNICQSISINITSDEDQRDRQQVYLHLIRQLIRQLVVQYEYEVSEMERRGNR